MSSRAVTRALVEKRYEARLQELSALREARTIDPAVLVMVPLSEASGVTMTVNPSTFFNITGYPAPNTTSGSYLSSKIASKRPWSQVVSDSPSTQGDIPVAPEFDAAVLALV